MSMAADLALAFAPELLAESLGYKLDPWQRRLISERPRKCLLAASRQSGKSFVTALACLETIISQPGCLVVLAAPSHRQSSELLRTIRRLYEKLPDAVPLENDGATKIAWRDGGRIIALPGEGVTTRGLSAPALIALDEAGFVDAEIVQALTPMLATVRDGRFIALSSAGHRDSWFGQRWHDTVDQSWTRISVTADDCPRISKDWLAEQRLEMGERRWRQEFFCEWATDAEDQFFATELIDRCFDKDLSPIW
jgi:hypothetical protein